MNMERDLLVGSTGFVGTNLAAAHPFGLEVHSSNVERSFSDSFDLVVYAGIPGTKFLANLNPAADSKVIEQAKNNIKHIQTERLVLISTTDVYGKNKEVSEVDSPSPAGLNAYGLHRLQLEQWVQSHYPGALTIRLPAIYGNNLKKNFVYDLVHRSPAFLSDTKYEELKGLSPLIERNYQWDASGLWKNERLEHAAEMDDWFESQPFNALSFTDSRSVFQFYDLRRLWGHIEWALASDCRVLNIAPPPLSAHSVYEYIYGKKWENVLDKPVFDYDMRSCLLTEDEHGIGYLESPEEELEQLKRFILKKRDVGLLQSATPSLRLHNAI